MRASLFEVERINSFSGDSDILFDVSLAIGRNKLVALLGRNGAGNTTTLRTIMGVRNPRAGAIRLGGVAINNLPPHAIAELGV